MKSSEVFNKLLSTEKVTLEEILNDDDFLNEIKIKNENLFEYLNYERMKSMIDLLIIEPKIGDSSIKSFRLPFVICEMF